MGLLDDIIADDTVYMVDPDGVGEAVSYTPQGGSATPYNATVDRGPVEVQDEGTVAEAFTVVLPYDSAGTNGPPAIDTGGDQIALKRRIGDSSNTTYRIRHILAQDAGGWTLLAY